MEKTILPGRIIKLHGVDGKVAARTLKPLSGNLKNLKTVFLEIEGKQVPFFVEEYEQQGDKTLILKFEGYNSPSEVSPFRGCNIFIPVPVSRKGRKVFELTDLLGFRILSTGERISGVITEVKDNKGNILLRVSGDKGTEFLVPFHQDLIVSADAGKKVIIMNLPEGLADINA